ncbi:MAG: hypothetical protein IRY99_17070 [Isosphaeraceae bacterium]|nr:hypothetical protein [Isosphaeraceae bacterium]
MKPRTLPGRLTLEDGRVIGVWTEFKEDRSGWRGSLRRYGEGELKVGQEYPIRLGDGRSAMITIRQVTADGRGARFEGKRPPSRETMAARAAGP